uniref:Uncharacterized protein n=1 Tax=Arundo donax TaxID=35708 RepID=A0A0A9DT68_ARUDO
MPVAALTPALATRRWRGRSRVFGSVGSNPNGFRADGNRLARSNPPWHACASTSYGSVLCFFSTWVGLREEGNRGRVARLYRRLTQPEEKHAPLQFFGAGKREEGLRPS